MPRTVLVLALLSSTACTNIKYREYAALVFDLDDYSELEISTYPARFPKNVGQRGALFQKLETADEHYFQLFIRDKETKAGPNPHVESVTVHSFSYQLGNGVPSKLLSDYPDNFWMQNNPRYEERNLPPIPFVAGSQISVKVSLTLNGRTFELEGVMPASERSLWRPTFLINQSI